MALTYAYQTSATDPAGLQNVDGSASALVWNAAGVAIFLGTVAFVGVQRRWTLLRSTVLAGAAGVVPAVLGIMGAGIVVGCAGSVATVVAHLALPVRALRPPPVAQRALN